MDETDFVPADMWTQIHFDTLWENVEKTLTSLAGQVWTDLNEHDPGVTLLQALTYNVADLGYRHTHPLADLLTLKEDDRELRQSDDQRRIFPRTFGPDWALTCTPITPDDYRRAILDLRSNNRETPCLLFADAQLVKEPLNQTYTYQYNEATRQYQFNAEAGEPVDGVSKLYLLGGYQLSVACSRDVTRDDAQEVLSRFLETNRNLCEQVREIIWLTSQPIDVRIDIELADDCQENDAVRVMAELYQRVDDWVSPTPTRASAETLLAQGAIAEAIYEGPRLQYGWIAQMPPSVDFTKEREIDISGLAPSLQSIRGVARLTRLQIGEQSTWTAKIEPKAYPVAWDDRDPLSKLLQSVNLFKRGRLQKIKESVLVKAVKAMQPAVIENQHDGLPIGRARSDAYRPASDRIPPCYGLQDNPSQLHGLDENKIRLQHLYQFFLPFEQWISAGVNQLANVAKILAFDRYTLKEAAPSLVWGFMWPYVKGSRLDTLHEASKNQALLYISLTAFDTNKELDIIDKLLRYFGAQRAPRVLSDEISPDDFIRVQQGYLEQFCTLVYNRANIQIDKVSALQKRIAARLGMGSELFNKAAGKKNLPSSFYLIEYRQLLPEASNQQFKKQKPSDVSSRQDKFYLVFANLDDDKLPVSGQLISISAKGSVEVNIAWALVEKVDGKVVYLDVDRNQNLKNSVQNLINAGPENIVCNTCELMFCSMDYALTYAKLPKGGVADLFIPTDTSTIQSSATLKFEQVATAVQKQNKIAFQATVETIDRATGVIQATIEEGGAWPTDQANYCWYVDTAPTDRFSFHVGIVLSRSWLAHSTQPDEVMAWVEQIVRDEVPCHITPHIHWLDDNTFKSGFGPAYGRWQDADMRLGDDAYALLAYLSLGKLPRSTGGIGVLHISTNDERARLVNPVTHQWKELKDVQAANVVYTPKSSKP